MILKKVNLDKIRFSLFKKNHMEKMIDDTFNL